MHNSYLAIKDYFHKLCEKSNHIQGFAGFFSRELKSLESSYKGIESPFLALFEYELGLEGPEMNTKAVRKLGFAIMYNQVAADDFEAQYSAIDKAEKIALKVIARMHYDNNTKGHLLYNSLMKDSVEIRPVELSSSDFGVEVTLSLKNSQALEIKECDWKDIKTACK